MRARFSLYVLVLSVGCSRPVAPAGSLVTNCDQRTFSGYTISFCHESMSNATAHDAVLYFHGMGGSAQEWLSHPMHSALREGPFRLKNNPDVISISFGPNWFLSDVGFLRKSRLDVIEQDFIPQLKSILGFTPSRLFVLGESMGGYNALRLAGHNPQAFAGAAALCPAIMSYSPYESPVAMVDFLNRHSYVDKLLLLKTMPLAMFEFPTVGDWERNDLLNLARSGQFRLPRTFLTYNDSDDFGFNDGITTFASLINSQVVEEAGGHCQHTPAMYESLAKFLVHRHRDR